MALYEHATRTELAELHENNIQMRFIGRRESLSPSLLAEMDKAMQVTAENTGLTLNLALNYGGRAEISDAVTKIAQLIEAGELTSADISEDLISSHLYAPDLPDPDLLIRTAGEMRVSNFLLWGIAYSEIWVTPTFWPDFSPTLLVSALLDFQSRIRKFGAVVD